jgi:hypothetical protein
LVAAALGAGAVGTGGPARDPGLAAIRLSTGIFPTFATSVSDYVNRCDPTRPTDVNVSAPANTTIDVAGQGATGGAFTTQVDQQENEAFTIVVHGPGGDTTHVVRCLPLAFPVWNAVRRGTPQAEFYATVINLAPMQPNNWPVIFDTNGVPVWWTTPSVSALNEPLPNGNLVSMPVIGPLVERRLDGSIVRTVEAAGFVTDFHDVAFLPDGNTVLATFEGRRCDLTPWGEGVSECVFHRLQVVTPAGHVVWEWRVEDDIPLSETPPRWRPFRTVDDGEADPWHFNSVEWTGDGFIVSFRNMDAIYKIDYATKNVRWKLGGSRTPESLAVSGDSVESIVAQHDARVVPGGTATVYDITIFDNGSTADRPPRMVRYRIDEQAGTATFVEALHDPIAPDSFCCGSARLLPTGNYVVAWGATPWITESEPDGTQVLRIDATFVYRAVPIMPGFYTREEIRAGMDAQFDGPHPSAERPDGGPAELGRASALGWGTAAVTR